MTDERIGTINADGSLIYPAKTFIGRDFIHEETSATPPVLHMLPGKRFVVGEIFYPPTFDVNEELDKLKAELAPKKPVVKPEDKL